MPSTIIKAKCDLFNEGLCFKKGEKYTIENVCVKTEAGLMEMRTVNEMGQSHIIGSWWRDFKIVKRHV